MLYLMVTKKSWNFRNKLQEEIDRIKS